MNFFALIFTRRYATYAAALIGSAVLLTLTLAVNLHFGWFFLGFLTLALLGTYDMIQRRHAILRSFPIAAHIRFLFESIRPEIRQYFLESDTDGVPFDRNTRSIVYQRGKGELDKRPLGTQLNVYGTSYEWINHSLMPAPVATEPFRIAIGGPDCTKPYSASVLNVSAMSFGSLSANAIRALNKGAKMGGFAHDTGEGGLSPYHRENGGDIIWEIGSGYFGCRTPDGKFSPDRFAEQAVSEQVKMIEIKLSQGAKPGHGGVLPAAKVSAEIAETRGVPMGVDCVSPARHSEFSTPTGLLAFVARLRQLSGGKPVGFKLCIGHPWEFLGIGKAMLATGIYPDFIVIDGKEGGTGAAPLEFIDHLGTPLQEGLMFVQNVLVGLNIRDRIKLGASGKIITAFDMARIMAMGADWCNSARGFMFAIGCIQSQQCHTDRCPTGVATQDKVRQHALVVPDKAQRVYNFHRSTLAALAEVIAAAGLTHPTELSPRHFLKRVSPDVVASYEQIHRFLYPGELLDGTSDERFAQNWKLASADSFAGVA
ncbi:MAG TPA: FMN-binding glutamate synthase family protein [Alphaproteobacteria bacterium]|jgi:glutamate synthase domain-containing protein 2|nr:FMN-binding glutamate synthase family protein [Alphaproteobacteria bacterium]